ncbi:hypothetical protein DL98DRAFT_592188 [Cadophora sp. DSE1049]|nr:hypothetical protein DL98DRAFT_592188 [Cadophora sp. DSE1049]
MNFVATIPRLGELFADLPPTSSTSPAVSQSSSLTSSLIILTLALLVLVPAIFITIIAYTEYHRLSCSIPWVKRLRKAIQLASGCCCGFCLDIAGSLSSNSQRKDKNKKQDGERNSEGKIQEEGGGEDGFMEGLGDGESSGDEREDANGTTERKGWWMDLGQRERYGKLFKNSSDGSGRGGGRGVETLLRDMEGSEDGVAVLL